MYGIYFKTIFNGEVWLLEEFETKEEAEKELQNYDQNIADVWIDKIKDRSQSET